MPHKVTSPSLVTLNQRQLAEAFGVSAKTIQQWDREGLRQAARLGMKGREAKYDVAAAIDWYIEHEVAAAVEAATMSEVETIKLRKLEVEVEAKEHDVQERREGLVPIDEVEALVDDALASVDDVLADAPDRFAPELADSAGISKTKARELLEDLVAPARGTMP